MGRVIAWLRDGRGMTQAELARAVDVHATTLSKYENQGRIPEDVFLRLCRALQHPPDFVIDATLRLVGRDLRNAVVGAGGAGDAAVSAPAPTAERRPTLEELRDLYDARAAADKEWTFALLRYFGADLQGPPDDLDGLPPRRPRRPRRNGKKG